MAKGKLAFDEQIGDANDVVVWKEKTGYYNIADTSAFTGYYDSCW